MFADRFSWASAVFFTSFFVTGCGILPDSIVQKNSVSENQIIFSDASKRGVFLFPSEEKPYKACVEPSPDIASDLSSLTNLALSAGPNAGGIAGSGIKLSEEITREITALVSRSQGLQLQRDILAQACLAYINGMIDQNQYLEIFRFGLSSSTTLIVVESLLAGTNSDFNPDSLNRLLNFVRVILYQGK